MPRSANRSRFGVFASGCRSAKNGKSFRSSTAMKRTFGRGAAWTVAETISAAKRRRSGFSIGWKWDELGRLSKQCLLMALNGFRCRISTNCRVCQCPDCWSPYYFPDKLNDVDSLEKDFKPRMDAKDEESADCGSRSRHLSLVAGSSWLPQLSNPLRGFFTQPPVKCKSAHIGPFDAQFGIGVKVVGAAGFEPTASSSRTKRATRLRHAPTGR